MSMIQSDLLLGQEGGAGYAISRSLRFNSSDSAYLSRTPASAGNRKTWTWAGWVKRCALGSLQFLFTGTLSGSGGNSSIAFNSDNTIYFRYLDAAASLTTTAVFRDTSAWYHIVAVSDTDNATADNRLVLYVNGVRQLGTISAPTLGQSNGYINFNNVHFLGTQSTTYSNFYLADIHFIDGQALTPSSFGEFDTNNVWQPKAYTGTYGTNGFHLDFADNSAATATALGKDSAGSNNWTPNNFSVTAGAGNDSLVDSPSSPAGQTDSGAGGTVVGNYATLNPLDKGSAVTLSNGNLDVSVGGTHNLAAATIMVSSGKYYAEFVATTLASGISALVGVCNPIASRTSYLGGTAGGVGYGLAGDKWVDGSVTGGLTSSTTGDVIGIALDKDNNQVSFYKNNSLLFTQTGLNSAQPYTFAMGHQNSAGYFNFGQRPFAYTAPSGFKALCTANLPTPTIANGATAMDVKLYTGNGSTQTISGLGFSPDFLWFKARSIAYSHALYDTVRGYTKSLVSNSTVAEGTEAGGLSAFNSDGFSLNGENTTYGSTNTNGQTYAAWCWDAGSSTVTNTSGSISSQVRANASAGFSVVTYTGTGANATVGHGLGVAPSLVIIKSRGSARNWIVWHKAFGTAGSTDYLYLNSTLEKGGDGGGFWWNSTVPGSSTFSLGSSVAVNDSAINYVAYCFAPVAGYSSFGSYTGNGSSDGPFVYTGFRPRWVLVKSSSIVSDWCIFDAARDGYNGNNDSLYPNSSNDENYYVLANEFDILSNGFKPRANRDRINYSAATFIYAAFGDPFAYARAR